jgi:hypothetical protein
MPNANLLNKSDHAFVSVTTPNYTPVDIVEDILDSIVTFADNTNFETYLTNEGYTHDKINYALIKESTADDILQEFCYSFAVNYIFDRQNRVEFKWFDTNTATAATINEAEIKRFEQLDSYTEDEIRNKISYQYDKDYQNDEYQSFIVYDAAGQTDWGERPYLLDMAYITDSTQAEKTADKMNQLFREPLSRWELEIPFDIGINTTFEASSFILFPHRDGIYNTTMCYRIIRRYVNSTDDLIRLELVERDYLSGFTYLLKENGDYLTKEDGYRLLGG